jgi:hypothetical protein
MTKNLGSFLGVMILAASAVALLNCATKPAPYIYVSLKPSSAQKIEGGQSLDITASVPNDLTNAGVSWSLNPATGAGTLVNPTTTSVTYQAPASVTSSTEVAVIASAIVQPTRANKISITIVPGPSFTTPTFPAGFVGTAYSQTVGVTGGIAPYSWAIVGGALPGGLLPSNTKTPTLTISGTPNAVGTFTFMIQVTDTTGASYTSPELSIQIQAANTLRITSTSPLPNGTVGTSYSFTFAAAGGKAPYTWSVETGSSLPSPLMLSPAGVLSGTPTSPGTSSFGITVTDSSSPANTSSTTFSLTISPESANLAGSYAFVFHGTNNITVSRVALPQIIAEAGTFTVAADGTTVSGVLDYNTTGGQNYIGQSFSGTASIGSNDFGTITFLNLTQGTQSFSIAMDSTLDHGRIIEFDNSGITGSGEVFKQTVTTCTAAGLSGDYVFGMTGGSAINTNYIYPATFAGRFNTDGISSIQQGEADENTPTITNFLSPISGTYKALSTGGACQITFSISGPVITMNAYPISSASGIITQALLVQIDPILSTSPEATVAGELDQQIGYPFSGTTNFSGTSVGALVGQISLNGGTTYAPDVWVAQLVATGTKFTLDYTEDQNGVVTTFTQTSTPQGPNGSFSIDSFGRVTFVNWPFQMYLINLNQGVFLTTTTTNPNPVLGYFDPQSTGITFSASTIKGTFEGGTVGAAYYQVPNVAGIYTLDGVSVISGTQDTSSSSGNSSGQTVTGTYTGIDGTTGFGNFTLTSPSSTTGVFCIVSPTKFVGITTPTSTTGANPQVVIFGH